MLERLHLQIVREIDRQGTMTAAANKLHLTQSALSHTMRKFERSLGAKIWEREKRSLRLTQAGHYLLEMANHVLPQLEHIERTMQQFARGKHGALRIGMECHPCYQWLLKVVAVYMPQWQEVELDIKQKFRFGGIGALLDYEIDLLVTPDPGHKPGLKFKQVFDYEQVLVVGRHHPLAKAKIVEPAQLADETLITYPVDTDRLDVYTQFLTPAGISPRLHKAIESTDLMMQMVAGGRGVAALPLWLVGEYAGKVPVVPVRLGRKGVQKKLYLGFRTTDSRLEYLKGFIDTARSLSREKP